MLRRLFGGNGSLRSFAAYRELTYSSCSLIRLLLPCRNKLQVQARSSAEPPLFLAHEIAQGFTFPIARLGLAAALNAPDRASVGDAAEQEP